MRFYPFVLFIQKKLESLLSFIVEAFVVVELVVKRFNMNNLVTMKLEDE
jgi:hypothetical protein